MPKIAKDYSAAEAALLAGCSVNSLRVRFRMSATKLGEIRNRLRIAPKHPGTRLQAVQDRQKEADFDGAEVDRRAQAYRLFSMGATLAEVIYETGGTEAECQIFQAELPAKWLTFT